MKPYIQYLLITVAAICKALADTLAWHYDKFTTRFNLHGDFWKINVVHKEVTTVFNYPVDAWHICNSILLCALLLIPFLRVPHFRRWQQYCIYGILFILVFNLFYNLIFI